MSLTTKPTPLEAWSILRAQSLNLIEAKHAAEGYDEDVLDQYKEQFEMAILTVMQNAAEELGSILKDTEFDTEEGIKPTVPMMRTFLDLIDGSDFEQLHLTAFLRVNNTDLLWERVKPV